MTGATTLRRTVTTASVLLATTTAFAAGFLVSEARSGAGPTYRLTAAGLDSGLPCDRLLQWYVGHGLERVTAWGWQQPIYGRAVPMAGAVPESSSGSAPSQLDTSTTSTTGTNVQEAGVDEPDLVKASGDLLVRIDNGSLETDDVGGAEPRPLGVAPLSSMGDPQLLLAGDRAVVIGVETQNPAAGTQLVLPSPRTRVVTYDLADPSHPTLVDSRVYDGSLVTARQVGSVVRLVLDDALPELDFVHPSGTLTEQQALEHNRQVVRDSTASDWLPQVTTETDGSSTSAALLDCSAVSVPEVFDGLGTLAVVGFDPSRPTVTDASAVATGSETAYMSPTHLYVAASPFSMYRGWGPMVAPDRAEPTRIYGFDLSGTSATYVGMGSVSGSVAGSWSMDEHNGVLRVAATASALAPSTSVVLLKPESGRLLEVGHLDGLGVGQQLKSVRWFDDTAVLVTFEQTDPFYVVDLTDAEHPRVLGALHLPGWSSYLHPVGPHLVLGLGQTAPHEVMVAPAQPPATVSPEPPTTGSPAEPNATASPVVRDPAPVQGRSLPIQRAKATLFDIADPAHPREVDTVTYPAGSLALAGVDPHQVTWLPGRDTLLTVISGTNLSTGMTPQTTRPVPRAWVSVLTLQDGLLHSRLVPVMTTSDVGGIRTVPLEDGRVVLVADDTVRFLSV